MVGEFGSGLEKVLIAAVLCLADIVPSNRTNLKPLCLQQSGEVFGQLCGLNRLCVMCLCAFTPFPPHPPQWCLNNSQE